MEWYFIVLIAVFAWAFLTISVYALIGDGFKDYFKYFYVVIFLSIFATIFSPILLFTSLMMFIRLFIDSDKDKGVVKITTFKTPKIEEEHRVFLKQLGFEEGTFESAYINREFKGFKNYRFELTYDGKGMFFGKPTEEQKHIIKQLKNLKSKTEKKEDIRRSIIWEQRTIERAKKNIEKDQKRLEEV